jgi:hypothetical protein
MAEGRSLFLSRVAEPLHGVFEQERAMAAASFAPKTASAPVKSSARAAQKHVDRAPQPGADRFASFYQSETEQGATTGGARSLRWLLLAAAVLVAAALWWTLGR